MPSLAIHLDRYTFGRQDRLLFDANVWLLLEGPQDPGRRDQRVGVYSGALARILMAESKLFLDALVLCEFVNVYARYYCEMDTGQRGRDYFKTYRDTEAFRPRAEEIAAAVRRIAKRCTPVDCPFGTIDLAELANEYSAQRPDVNDQIIAMVCRANDLKLVTDDADFADLDVRVLSANYKYFR
ncbi:MAG: PIN domain-containing protein [Chloroflexota bacterium]